MKERLKRKQLGTLKGILVIVGLLALIFVIAAAMFVIADYFNVTFLEYVEYALFILLGVLIIRKWVTEFEYTLTDTEFTADRYIGKRPRRLFDVRLSHIVSVGTDPPQGCKGRPQRLTFRSRRSGVVYITYVSGDDKKCAFFSPSSELLEQIETHIRRK